jgi:SAM-dependent methyltransferase
MNTKEFTLLDKFLANCRLSAVGKYIKKNDVILDIGCGVQHYLLSRFRHKFSLGYGLDYDVKDCQQGNLRLVNYKYEGSLPLKENFFDKVFLVAVLEHVEEKNVGPLFFEFFRILKKNGRVAITTPTPRSKPLLEFIAFKLKLVAPEEVTDHKHYYLAEEIRILAEKSGLRLIKVKYFQLGFNCLYILEK